MRERFYTGTVAINYAFYSIMLFCAAMITLTTWMKTNEIALLFPTIALFILMAVCIKISSRYGKGNKGERIVANILDQLDESYHVFHDVKLPNHKGNIDHIILGKNGLFVLETKHLKSLIKVEGDLWTGYGEKELRLSPSLQLKRNIVELKKFLGKRKQKFWVDEAIIFTNPKVELYIVNPTVRILKPNELIKWIKSRNYHMLKKEEIEERYGK